MWVFMTGVLRTMKSVLDGSRTRIALTDLMLTGMQYVTPSAKSSIVVTVTSTASDRLCPARMAVE